MSSILSVFRILSKRISHALHFATGMPFCSDMYKRLIIKGYVLNGIWSVEGKAVLFHTFAVWYSVHLIWMVGKNFEIILITDRGIEDL
jgi:hypothetical protein